MTSPESPSLASFDPMVASVPAPGTGEPFTDIVPQADGALPGRGVGIGRRVALMVTDQALSSVSNIATGIVAARSLQQREFGAFGLAIVVYTLAIGFTRSMVTEPLVSLYSRVHPESLRDTLRAATGSATVFGLAIATAVAAIGALLGGVAWTSLGALALVLPGLVLQDAWRYSFVVVGRPRSAVLIDAIWCITQAVALIAILTFGRLTLLTIVLWWGGSGVVAALAGSVQAVMTPSLLATRQWIREHQHLSWRYATDFAVATGSVQVTLIALGAVAGLSALGAIRGAMVFFGPIVVLFGGTYLALGAEGARLRAEPVRLRRLMVSASCLLFAVGLPLLVLGAVLPDDIGHSIFGDTWASAHSLILPVGVAVLGNCAASGAIVGLRALAAAKASLRGRLAVAPAAVVAPLIGAAFGARGFAIGTAVASWVGAFIWWRQFGRALREDIESVPAHGAADGA